MLSISLDDVVNVLGGGVVGRQSFGAQEDYGSIILK
jgi:hypothetical protein